ncbi:hypothetical protein NBRC103581_02249 [Gluconobacter wancherniae NBRC 103581]|uniref:Uncharacterized protein n=1 Tax=Gluconobacter wancherniae NBRC 103581 TaxID=656744 RepID=A0A511B476_9PROT|nr:hypothetical protein [Gluconobacter wancherniae]GBD57658.1 hypothetical protein NBRC103581_02249 [Gluconobacter wancherniae NBRC 103581]GBR62268.1 hypothetical protein AA103581_0221 [Gluconobacter wancherniae NBRC 103581]GEK94483.1 hypothetical protein GWA01_22530 [Gluconobacter wancherniae NBRC 103581]
MIKDFQFGRVAVIGTFFWIDTCPEMSAGSPLRRLFLVGAISHNWQEAVLVYGLPEQRFSKVMNSYQSNLAVKCS